MGVGARPPRRSRRLAEGADRCRSRRGRGARPRRQARHHPVALLRRTVPAVLGAARPPRTRLPGVVDARRERRRHGQSRHRRRDGGVARREGAAARLRQFRRLPARRHDGQDAGTGTRAVALRVGAGQGAGGARGTRAAGAGRRRRQQPRRRALGLALPPGESAASPSSTWTRARSSRTSSWRR